MKERSGKVLPLLLVLIIFILVVYIFKDKLLDNEKDTASNNKTTDSVEKEQKEDSKNNFTTKNEVDFYTYEKNMAIEDSGEEESFIVSKNVYLFKDGSYYYNYVDYGDVCGVWSIGKYEVNDNILNLIEQKHGGCDNCYYTKDLHNYSFVLRDDSIISEDDETLIMQSTEVIPELNVEEIEEVRNCDLKEDN